MHSSGSMKSCSTLSYSASSGVGWMQSTGQTSTQELSLVPMQGSAITYAKGLGSFPGSGCDCGAHRAPRNRHFRHAGPSAEPPQASRAPARAGYSGDVILLTGATGVVGGEVLPALLARGEEVRVLVRDPRKLGEHRVNVQIALGDLRDPFSIRHAT